MRKSYFTITDPKQVKVFTVIAGLIFLAPTIWLSVVTYQQILMQSTWDTVPAKVLRIEVNSGRRSRTYKVTYQYEVGGDLYEGSGTIDRSPSSDFEVYVNPNNPADSGAKRVYWPFLVWIIFVLPLSIGLIFFARPMTLQERKKYGLE